MHYSDYIFTFIIIILYVATHTTSNPTAIEPITLKPTTKLCKYCLLDCNFDINSGYQAQLPTTIDNINGILFYFIKKF